LATLFFHISLHSAVDTVSFHYVVDIAALHSAVDIVAQLLIVSEYYNGNDVLFQLIAVILGEVIAFLLQRLYLDVLFLKQIDLMLDLKFHKYRYLLKYCKCSNCRRREPIS